MPTTAPVQRNPDRTRRRILQAAIKLFATHGFHAVSVDEIVGRAEVNKRMVYHYFGSKDALFEAALAEVYRRIEAVEFGAVEQGRSPREKLARLLESYFAFLDAEPEFTRLLQWENLEKGRHLTKENHLLTKNPFFARFRTIVEDGVAAGEFRPDLDVTHLMIHFIGLCFIYHSNRFSLSQSLEIDLGDAAVKQRGLRQVLRLVFEGIAQPGCSAATS
ncbi:MAG: TetR/AcrR family transcriptional regulator [Opitutaceae bacterium]|nr:TetR/AcrR family transcriptional regulator [Opitutaceae bacterium]